MKHNFVNIFKKLKLIQHTNTFVDDININIELIYLKIWNNIFKNMD